MFRVCSLLVVLLSLSYLSEASKDSYKLVNVTSKYLLHNGNSLYYIDERSENWYVARKSCESMGFNLISFETIEEFNAINRFMDATGATKGYWTSGTDFIHLGHHAWFPNGISVPSELWGVSQPDNKNGQEHCDSFRYRGTYKMNDEPCTVKYFYVCELNLTP
ncbi:C-type lectin 37Da-like [Drosophila kikkawai]|uniref:C-type lectin 37Da-like n=1 Tax=Drosophila kikkawai TaxID=30033 RepID=A0A6P4J0N9_DROKI|nr:C-type lectin 37Da-like [Drosophila kikkawai]